MKVADEDGPKHAWASATRGLSANSRYACFAIGFVAGSGCMSAWYFASGVNQNEEERNALWSLAPIIVADGIYMIMCMYFSRQVACTLHTSEKCNKDAIRNSWTNLGVVSALIASIAGAAWMLDAPGGGSYEWQSHWFGILAANSFLWSTGGALLPTLSLLFTDGMDDQLFGEFMKDFKGLVGYPVFFIAASMLSLFASLLIRNRAIYGQSHTAVLCFLCAGLWGTILYICIDLWQYTKNIQARK
eukprot:gnl/TRDRNA2_/TRDRNA2_86614_c0_seq1.p1 gnl/TRDRNA2_/TRDRNA2_86614_c0~~gnl/TRDRNA2_/TRDRNA2_86614_c0_seq1.p1  ORF type:complete len:245 (-),score=22.41 gnl/TRDRNA2_/TRDRNA2_86614_c0_seq1:260-994(-)